MLCEKKRPESFLNFLEHLCRNPVKMGDASFFPGDAFHMIGKNQATDLVPFGYLHFEWIPFGLKGNRRHDGEPHNSVVLIGRENESRTVSTLLMAFDRIKIQLYNIAALGIIAAVSHQISSPTGLPQSVSA